MKKWIFIFLILITTACSDTSTSSNDDNILPVLGLLSQPTATLAPTLTPAPTPDFRIANINGWRVFVTNETEIPSEERGWRYITLDVVFESLDDYPYPLYYQKSVSVLDSTGTWRDADLCCTNRRNYFYDEVIRVPRGIRVKLTSEPIRIPELASITQIQIRACGSEDCDQQYAVFTATVDSIIENPPTSDMIFPFESMVSDIPIYADEPLSLQFDNLPRMNITFLPNPTLTRKDGAYYLNWDITLENLTGDDIWSTDLPQDWVISAINRFGNIRGTNGYCDSDESIPPSYTGTLACEAIFRLDTSVDIDALWIGFALKNGIHFAQSYLEIDNSAIDIAKRVYLEGHSSYVTDINWSPDGTQVVTGSWDSTIRLWDVETAQTIKLFEGHTDWVNSVVFSPDGKQLLSAGRDGTIRIWDISTGGSEIYTNQDVAINKAVWSLDGESIIYLSYGALFVGQLNDEPILLTSSVDEFEIAPNDTRIAVVMIGDVVRTEIWDYESKRRLAELFGHERPDGLRPLAWSNDGQFLAGANDRSVII